MVQITKDVTGTLDVPRSCGAVIYGSVGPDAAVTADGNVVVLGCLQGAVHAGRSGDTKASISASSLQSQQLQIAGVTAARPVQTGMYHGPTTVHIDFDTGELTATPQRTAPFQTSSQAWLPSLLTFFRSNAPAAAAAFTGTYAVVAGLALMLAPVTVLGLLFDASQVPAGWIRVGGILFTLIGMQYLGTSLMDFKNRWSANSFYTATVWSRLFLVAAFSAVVALRELGCGLLLLAALNAVGALSMLRALRVNAPLSVCN